MKHFNIKLHVKREQRSQNRCDMVVFRISFSILEHVTHAHSPSDFLIHFTIATTISFSMWHACLFCVAVIMPASNMI